jgi:hypothetical protein
MKTPCRNEDFQGILARTGQAKPGESGQIEQDFALPPAFGRACQGS